MRARPSTGVAPQGGEAAPSPARAALQRGLERAAALGILAHALFLPISMAGMQIGLGVALCALVLLRLTGRRVWARSALDLPCLALAGAAAVSVALGAAAGSRPVGWHEATLWRSVLSPIVVLSALEVGRGGSGVQGSGSRRLALAALAVWAVASLAPSALAWPQYWTGFDPLHALGLRAEPVRAVVPRFPDRFAAVGFFRWYQRLAHNLIPPLCLAAAVALYGGVGRRLRLLLAAAALAASAAVVLTMSRAAWATLVLAALLLPVLARERLRPRAVVLAALGGLAAALHPGVRERLAHVLDPGEQGDRIRIWTVCRAVVKDHPLTGVGFGNLPRRSIPYYERLAPDYPLRAWCHDSFFTAWAEGGPLLFAALAAFWALAIRAFWRLRRTADRLGRAAAAGALAGLAAMLANSLAHDILYSSEAVYGLGFALGTAAALARRSDSRAGGESTPDPPGGGAGEGGR